MRLQSAPLGLLAAFQLKQEGMNPPEFGDAVLPQVNVDKFYYPLENEQASVSANPIIDGTLISLRPATGEAWIIWAASGGISLAAGDVIVDQYAMHIGFRPTPFSSGCLLEQGPLYTPRTIVAATTLRVAKYFNAGFLLPPNSDLTFTSGGTLTLGANRAFVAQATITRIKL